MAAAEAIDRRGGRLLLAVLLLALVVSGHYLDAHHRGLKRCRWKHEIHSPIKTVVVVVMENRSFDHILGWLRRRRPDIDGLTGAESNRLNASDPSSPEIFVTDIAHCVCSSIAMTIAIAISTVIAIAEAQRRRGTPALGTGPN